MPAQPPPGAPPVVVQWGNTPVPGADVKKEETAPKPNPFRLSWFTWNQAATTTILGVGKDYQGADGEVYSWDFTLAPRYFVYDKPEDQVNIFGEIGWTTELTNSDSSTKKRDTFFKDMQLGIAYSHIIQNEAHGDVEKGENRFIPGVSFRTLLPTSLASRNEGKYLVTALGASSRGFIRLLGNKSDFLANIVVSGGLTWSHLFSKSYNPVNADLDRPRQNATGQTISSDILSGKSFDQDRLTLSLGYFFPIYKSISFGQSIRLAKGFKHHNVGSPDGCDTKVLTGCVAVPNSPDATETSTTTTFDTSFSWFPDNNWGHVSLGYQNETAQLGEDGQRRSIFYSPDAQFYLDLAVHLDGVYDEAKKAMTKKSATTLDPQKHF
jgi:hypothetical protein